jgi:hypothetical protein
MIESTNEMTPEYLKELKHPHRLGRHGADLRPGLPRRETGGSINAFAGSRSSRDELAHAHIAYHILEELWRGPENSSSATRRLLPLRLRRHSTAGPSSSLPTAHDQAGFCPLGDIDKCPTDPEAGLNKVMLGENPTSATSHLDEAHQRRRRRREPQRAVDWMFRSVEWFGLLTRRRCTRPSSNTGSRA